MTDHHDINISAPKWLLKAKVESSHYHFLNVSTWEAYIKTLRYSLLIFKALTATVEHSNTGKEIHKSNTEVVNILHLPGDLAETKATNPKLNCGTERSKRALQCVTNDWCNKTAFPNKSFVKQAKHGEMLTRIFKPTIFWLALQGHFFNAFMLRQKLAFIWEKRRFPSLQTIVSQPQQCISRK